MRAAMVSVDSAQTLSESVYRSLRSDILTCQLRPGFKLRISAIAEEKAVSLSAIREALSRLSAEGLVTAEPQRGYTVAPVSIEDLTDLTTTRISIENLCLARSIALGGVEWETAVVAAMHRLSRTPYFVPGEPRVLSEDWARAHNAFHEALVSATQSPWLLRIRSNLYSQSERYRRLSVPLFSAKRDVDGEHRALSGAALARDLPLATRLMGEHLTLTMQIIINGLQQPLEAAEP